MSPSGSLLAPIRDRLDDLLKSSVATKAVQQWIAA
jgi:hypothetical protein